MADIAPEGGKLAAKPVTGLPISLRVFAGPGQVGHEAARRTGRERQA
jgi:hypothetical protein